MIVKDIKVGDICVYISPGSLPKNFVGKEFEIYKVKEKDLEIQRNGKIYIVDADEIEIKKRPIIKQKFTEDDPYGEEKWEDDELEDIEYKKSKIKKFRDFFKTRDDYSIWMNRKINNMIGY